MPIYATPKPRSKAFFSPSTEFSSDLHSYASTLRPSLLATSSTAQAPLSVLSDASTCERSIAQSVLLSKHLTTLSFPCKSESKSSGGRGAPALGRREKRVKSEGSTVLRRSVQVVEGEELKWQTAAIIFGLLVVEFSDWQLSSAISYGNGPAWRILYAAGLEETADGALRPSAMEHDYNLVMLYLVTSVLGKAVMPLTGAYLADAYVGRAKMTLLCTSLRSVAVGICVLSAALLHRGSGTTDNDSTIDVVVIATYTAAALLTCISQLGRGSTLVLIADQMQETTHYVADVVRDATSDDNKIQSSYKSNMLEPEALETVCHNIMDPSSTEARYTSNNIKRGKRQNTSRPHVLLSWALYYAVYSAAENMTFPDVLSNDDKSLSTLYFLLGCLAFSLVALCIVVVILQSGHARIFPPQSELIDQGIRMLRFAMGCSAGGSSSSGRERDESVVGNNKDNNHSGNDQRGEDEHRDEESWDHANKARTSVLLRAILVSSYTGLVFQFVHYLSHFVLPPPARQLPDNTTLIRARGLIGNETLSNAFNGEPHTSTHKMLTQSSSYWIAFYLIVVLGPFFLALLAVPLLEHCVGRCFRGKRRARFLQGPAKLVVAAIALLSGQAYQLTYGALVLALPEVEVDKFAYTVPVYILVPVVALSLAFAGSSEIVWDALPPHARSIAAPLFWTTSVAGYLIGFAVTSALGQKPDPMPDDGINAFVTVKGCVLGITAVLMLGLFLLLQWLAAANALLRIEGEEEEVDNDEMC